MALRRTALSSVMMAIESIRPRTRVLLRKNVLVKR
jgi:hypothetical protein